MFDPGGESPQYNQGQEPSQVAHAILWGFLFGSTLNVALVFYSMFRFPTSWSLSWKGMEGVLATTGIVMVYALLGWFVTPRIERRDARILRYASLFGLVIGLFFAIMMLIEYLVPHTPRQNVILAFAIFGTFFLLLSVAGFVGACATRSAWSGVLTAVWSAMIGSLIWFVLLLVTYYAFLGTDYEARFLETDQVIADFERSGMNDLRAFIVQDYLGGGFFHLLLGPLLAFALGAIGAIIALTLVQLGWIRKHRGEHVDP